MRVSGLEHGIQGESLAEARLARAAHEFEAQIMKELIQPMTRSDDEEDGMRSGGALSEFAGEALGQSLSQAGIFGIADRIAATLTRNETRH